MPEQYVFTVAFDRDIEGDNDTEKQVDPEWEKLVQDIAAAVNHSGLPTLEGDRWEEFGTGRIFWGTQPECAALKRVLSDFPISIEEERNLETGYYTNSDMTYFVPEDGKILGISKSDVLNQNRIVAKYNAIPLDAYKEPRIELELETLFQQFLAAEAQSMAREASVAPQTQVSPDLQNRIALQQEQLESLEKQVQDLSHQLSISQELADRKIDPADHETLRQQSANQSKQITQFEEAIAILKTQLVELQNEAAKKIEPGVYEALQHQVNEKDRRHAELEKQLGHSTDEISHWQEVADRKIDPAEHEELQQKSADQMNRITQLEESVSLLHNQVEELQNLADQKIEPALHNSLQLQADNQAERIAELTQQVTKLENEASRWKSVAAEKIDCIEHEELLAQQNAEHSQEKAALQEALAKRQSYIPIWVAGVAILCSLAMGIAGTAALVGGSESALPVSQEIQVPQ